jgi:hypothetical protein
VATPTGASQPACVVSRDTGSLPRGAVGRDGSVACNGGHCVVIARAASLCFRSGLSSFSCMLYAASSPVYSLLVAVWPTSLGP